MAMTARWDNIEILQAVARHQERFGGGEVWGVAGRQRMEEIASTQVTDEKLWRGFIQELEIAAAGDYLTFTVEDYSGNAQQTRRSYPYQYLQQIRDFALTVAGQDRARGRVVVQPLPDPAEDDGRLISTLILQRVAEAIDKEYSEGQAVTFLEESGALFPELPQDRERAGQAEEVLLALNEWGSEGRRILRSFLGRWLDDRLI